MISLKPTTSEREEWMILAELKFKSATTTDKILDIPTDYYCEGQSNYTSYAPLDMICRRMLLYLNPSANHNQMTFKL